MLVVLLLLPGGLSGAFFRVRDLWLRWLARRKGIVVPSLLADVATADEQDAARARPRDTGRRCDEDVPDAGAGEVRRDPDAAAAGRRTRPGTRAPRPRFRHPVRWLDGLTGDGPVRPLLILFGLNAVDEVARISFSVTAPTIADDFGVGIAGVTIPFVLAFGAALALSVPIANVADRGNRVRIALLGGLVFAGFSMLVGLSVSIWMVAFMLAGSQIGKAFIEPSHTSLLADYYEVGLRPRIFSFYRAGNAVGALIGGITAGYIAEAFSWRVPFFVFAVPTRRCSCSRARRCPSRAAACRRRSSSAPTRPPPRPRKPPPSLAEAWRMCWQIDSLRRIYRVLPFLTPAIAGFAIFCTFLYRDVFGVDDSGRGWVIGLVEGPAQLVGLTIGARLGMRMFAKDPKLIFRLLSRSIFIVRGGHARVRVGAGACGSRSRPTS